MLHRSHKAISEHKKVYTQFCSTNAPVRLLHSTATLPLHNTIQLADRRRSAVLQLLMFLRKF